jgi:hypothetical protein
LQRLQALQSEEEQDDGTAAMMLPDVVIGREVGEDEKIIRVSI